MDKHVAIKEALRQLAVTGKREPSRTEMLRAVFDDVEALIKADIPLEAVVRSLQEMGIKFTFNGFRSALQRIRKERRDAATEH